MKAIQILYSLYAFVPVGVCVFAFPLILLSKAFRPIASLYYWFIFVVSDFLMLSRESKSIRQLLLGPMKSHMECVLKHPGVASDSTDAAGSSIVIKVEEEAKDALSQPKSPQSARESKEGQVFRVLEIGPGTGTNLPFYPAGVNLSFIELNPLLHKQISSIRTKYPQITIDQVILGNAENMSACGIGDETFDAVVGTHILCCIKDTSAVLKEIRRILKPGGRFYTCEFVAYSDDCKSAKKWIQKMYAPFWSFFSLGCKAGNQNVSKHLKDHLFDVNSLVEMIHPTLPITHAVTLYGSAGKI